MAAAGCPSQISNYDLYTAYRIQLHLHLCIQHRWRQVMVVGWVSSNHLVLEKYGDHVTFLLFDRIGSLVAALC